MQSLEIILPNNRFLPQTEGLAALPHLENPESATDLYHYRLQMKFAKVMFSQVSVCPQGGVCVWQTPRPPPRAGTPSGQAPSQAGTPPGQVHPHWAGTSRAGTPSLGRYPPGKYTPWQTVNKRPVRILLECILVFKINLVAADWMTHVRAVDPHYPSDSSH